MFCLNRVSRVGYNEITTRGASLKYFQKIETVKRVHGCYSTERIVLHRSFIRLKWNQISRFARNSQEARRDGKTLIGAEMQRDLHSFNCSSLSSVFTETNGKRHVDAKQSKKEECKKLYEKRLHDHRIETLSTTFREELDKYSIRDFFANFSDKQVHEKKYSKRTNKSMVKQC